MLLDEETQQRNIVAWRPVVIDVLEGYTSFPREAFDKHLETFYPLAVGLMEKEMGSDLRGTLWGMFRRVGEVKFNMPEMQARRESYAMGRESRTGSVSATPTSPGYRERFDFEAASGGGGRRTGSSRSSRVGSQTSVHNR